MLRKKVSKEYLDILWKGRIQEIENISEYYYYTEFMKYISSKISTSSTEQ